MLKTENQILENYSQIIEKIVFDDDELKKVKTTVKNLTEGKISAKELKELLVQCRGRIVDEITEYLLFIGEKIVSENTRELTPAPSSILPTSPSQIEEQLRAEIKEKNDLLETVAIRVNQLVSKFDNNETSEDQRPIPIEEVKKEVERCLKQISAKEWIDMCFYEDYKFFVKLYPKLEELYEERVYQKDKNSGGEEKKIMANRMKELGFPEDIETIAVQYISVRNNFNHSMTDISPSNLELTRDVFANVLVYLIITSLNSTILSSSRELVYSCLTDFFSRRLTGSPPFRKIILDRLKNVF